MHPHLPEPGAPPSSRTRVRSACAGILIFVLVVAGASAPAAAIDLQLLVQCSAPYPNIDCIFVEPVVSPDGDCIAFTDGTTYPPYYEWWPGLAFVRVGGGTCGTAVRGAASSNWHLSPAWSPDGTRLAFVSEGPDSEHDGLWTVAIDDDTGSSLVQVVASGDVADPAWSLDGALIAYVASDGIRAVPSPGGASVLAAPGGRAPSWGPDGQLVFERDWDLWIRRGDGTERRLTTTSEREASPAWSPQGGWIAYAAQRGGNWDIWVIAATGGTPVRVTASIEDEGHPSWTARGDRLVYAATLNEHDSIWMATNLPDWTVGVERATWGGMKSLYR